VTTPRQPGSVETRRLVIELT